MAENRTQSRLQVVWNAALRLPSKHIIQAKILNISVGGLQFSCAENLQIGHRYDMQIHVPQPTGSTATTLVPCFAECLYVILSGREFRVGAKISGLSAEHTALLTKWSDRSARGAA